MKTSMNIGLKQSQKLIMTQSLRQSIEILQMSTIELAEKISEEFLENPLLEELTSMQTENPVEAVLNRNLSGDEEREIKKSSENEIFEDSSDSGFIRTGGDEDKHRSFIENTVKTREGLTEHLLWQAKMTAATDRIYDLLEELITSLNGDGFYESHVIGELKEKYGSEEVDSSIAVVQGFDPQGCCSSGVNETLLSQAKSFYPGDKVLIEMLEIYYDHIVKLDYQYISKKMDISFDEIVEKSKLLHNLNPFPGRQYSVRDVRFIIPDMEVKLVDDDVILSLNDDWIPGIKLSSYYTRLLKEKKVSDEQREYLNEKLQSARALIKNITHRRDTIKSVVSIIMERQREFLLKGPGHFEFFDSS